MQFAVETTAHPQDMASRRLVGIGEAVEVFTNILQSLRLYTSSSTVFVLSERPSVAPKTLTGRPLG